MIKVHINYANGQYHASLLEDDDAMKWERVGHCVVSIPESKAVEWGQFQDQQQAWHNYWKSLSNQFWNEIGFHPEKD